MLAKEYQKVEQYDEPSAILEKLSEKKSEMSASERGFLCGLIKKYCPKKIVEVGVAAGGTTSVILSCINELKLECQMYSVDISENYYRGGYKQTGYLVEEVKKQEIATAHHTFLLGKTLPERIEEIGADIDFLILDTMHVLPGEILDFIVAFPYLKKDAIVVLHDIGLQFRAEYRRMIATGILFQTVVADKFWNNQGVYPNIAGFQITEDTGKYMRDMFLSLTLPWQYTLQEKHLKEYERVISQKYDAECLTVYQQAVECDKQFMRKENLRQVEMYMQREDFFDFCQNFQVLLYGAGNRGQDFIVYAKQCKIPITGFIVSDGQNRADEVLGLPVFYYSQIPYEKKNVIIVITSAIKEIENTLRDSEYNWVKFKDDFWREIQKYNC